MARKILCALAAWLALSLIIPCQSPAAQKWAVVVGIDDYGNPDVSDLSAAGNDAKGLARTLTGELGFPEKNVLVFTTGGPSSKEPSTGNIINALKYVAKKSSPEDLFILFFAGHGVTTGGRGYLLTKGSDPRAVEYTSLPVNLLAGELDKIKAEKRLLLIDACRNDPEKGRGDAPNLLQGDFSRGVSIAGRQAERSGDAVSATLYSCEVGQRAFEWPEKKRGFFSWYLEEGLKGSAADAEGRVTLAGLVAYVRQEVPDRVQRNLGVGKAQTPWAEMSGNDPGNWVIHQVGEARLGALKSRMDEKRKQLDALSAMEQKDAAARAKEAAEAAEHRRRLAEMDAKIAAMQKRLGTSGAQEGDSLDAMLAMVTEKERQQAEYERLQEQRRQEEEARKAEMERLQKEKRYARLKEVQEDIAKYEKIVNSSFGKSMAPQAWQTLAAKYPEAQSLNQGDTRGLLSAYDGSLANSIGMRFVFIEPGTFMIGSPSSEQGRDKDETQHRVTLTRGFCMQTTEVTQGQWKRVMGSNPSHFSSCGDDCPVEQVSWNDAQEFIRKLNRMEGTNKYRLPTEAEWEYAARAGTDTPFNTGRCLDTSQANYDGNNPLPGCLKGRYRHEPISVGSFSPNAWGLYDMHGNVYEWCQDWFGNYPSGNVTDPDGPSSGSGRVFRGGGWGGDARYSRSARRNGSGPGYRYDSLGFRLVMEEVSAPNGMGK